MFHNIPCCTMIVEWDVKGVRQKVAKGLTKAVNDHMA